MKDSLSDVDLSVWERDGFLVLEGFLDSQEVDCLDSAIVNLVNAPLLKDKQMVYLEDSAAGEDRILSRIEKFVEMDEVFRSIIYGDRLTAILEKLFKGAPILFKEKINFKLPGGGGFEPHQDIQPGWDDYAPYFITAFFTVDESTVENGCLEVAPGHHKRGWIGERFKPLSEESLQGIEFIELPSKPGDLVLFDCFLPHQSAKNLTDKSRRNLYVTYNAKSDGDHREKYFADKRAAFPPDNEREAGKSYSFKV